MTMKVDGIFNIKKRGKVIAGSTLWTDNVYFTNGQILACGDKKWRVIGVDSFRQGCFGMAPTWRHHGLQLEPIGHSDQPNVGDELTLSSTSS